MDETPTFFYKSSILITGGTGYLGSRLVKRLLELGDDGPSRICVYSRGWQAQENLQRELGNPDKVRWFIGDILDKDRLSLALRGVDYVIHTAAFKSIQSAAYNPSPVIAVNVNGTENVLAESLEAEVKRVMVISSDKATASSTLYGSTKHVCEALAVAFNSYGGKAGTRFSACRYGNVFNSSGSVVPLFKLQRQSGKLTLTADKMTRFWITPSQAVSFVLRCLTEMVGGEVFIPHLPSSSILDIATTIAPEAEIEIVGVRPGEKMHEVMVVPEEAHRTRDYGWAYVIEPQFPFWTKEFHSGGSPVPADWTYSSASAQRLSRDDIKVMLDDAD